MRRASAIILASAVALSAAGCGAWPFSRVDDRVVFVSPEGLIGVVKRGAAPRWLTPISSQELEVPGRWRYSWPTWSPDASHVAYLGVSGLGAGGAVSVVGADGGAPVMLTTANDRHPVYAAWSPGGDRLAVLTANDDSLYLEAVTTSGREPTRRILAGRPLYLSWSADSAALLVHNGGQFFPTGAGRLEIVPMDPAKPTLEVEIDPEEFRAPAWSPQGDWQVMAGDAGVGTGALYLRDAAGRLRRFAEVSGPPAAVWSPSGQQLAWSQFVGPPFGYDGIMVSTPDGRTRRKVTDARVLAFFWAPASDQLAYITVDDVERAMEWWVVPAAGGTERRLGAFQPTGQFVQLATYFDQYNQSHWIWSADGQRLVYAGWPVGEPTVDPPWLFELVVSGNATPQRLVTGRIGFYAPPQTPAVPSPTPARSRVGGAVLSTGYWDGRRRRCT